MSTRRHFLGTLGKALGAGGLLLPWSGKGALALPADLGPAAKLPMTAAPMPFSAEALELRKIRRALQAIQESNRRDGWGPGGPGSPWYDTVNNEYLPIKERLAGRPVCSWVDCVELAEAIWTFWDKRHRDGPLTGPMISKLDDGCSSSIGYHASDLVVALVEGVLTLGGGDRFDPRMGAGEDVHHA